MRKGIVSKPQQEYNFAMNPADVRAMTVEEKLQIMEAIWEDFRDRFDQMEISDDQRALLDTRRARVRDGQASLLDWDSARAKIGRA